MECLLFHRLVLFLKALIILKRTQWMFRSRSSVVEFGRLKDFLRVALFLYCGFCGELPIWTKWVMLWFVHKMLVDCFLSYILSFSFHLWIITVWYCLHQEKKKNNTNVKKKQMALFLYLSLERELVCFIILLPSFVLFVFSKCQARSLFL